MDNSKWAQERIMELEGEIERLRGVTSKVKESADRINKYADEEIEKARQEKESSDAMNSAVVRDLQVAVAQQKIKTNDWKARAEEAEAEICESTKEFFLLKARAEKAEADLRFRTEQLKEADRALEKAEARAERYADAILKNCDEIIDYPGPNAGVRCVYCHARYGKKMQIKHKTDCITKELDKQRETKGSE